MCLRVVAWSLAGVRTFFRWLFYSCVYSDDSVPQELIINRHPIPENEFAVLPIGTRIRFGCNDYSLDIVVRTLFYNHND